DVLMMVLIAALAGAVVAFLVFNFNPASIFMGDAGSLFIGFTLATASVRASSHATSGSVPVLVPIVMLGLPIADTLLAMLRRAVHRQPLFSADRAHLHHLLIDCGLSQRQVLAVLGSISGLLGAAAVSLRVAAPVHAICVLAAVAALAWLFLA